MNTESKPNESNGLNLATLSERLRLYSILTLFHYVFITFFTVISVLCDENTYSSPQYVPIVISVVAVIGMLISLVAMTIYIYSRKNLRGWFLSQRSLVRLILIIHLCNAVVTLLAISTANWLIRILLS